MSNVTKDDILQELYKLRLEVHLTKTNDYGFGEKLRVTVKFFHNDKEIDSAYDYLYVN